MRALALLALITLAGCASTRQPPCAPEIRIIETERLEFVPVPDGLSESCYPPEWPKRPLQVDDLLRWIDAAESAIAGCDDRFSAIRNLTGDAKP